MKQFLCLKSIEVLFEIINYASKVLKEQKLPFVNVMSFIVAVYKISNSSNQTEGKIKYLNKIRKFYNIIYSVKSTYNFQSIGSVF